MQRIHEWISWISNLCRTSGTVGFPPLLQYCVFCFLCTDIGLCQLRCNVIKSFAYEFLIVIDFCTNMGISVGAFSESLSLELFFLLFFALLSATSVWSTYCSSFTSSSVDASRSLHIAIGWNQIGPDGIVWIPIMEILFYQAIQYFFIIC